MRRFDFCAICVNVNDRNDIILDIQSSKEFLAQTLAGDEEAVTRALDVSHIHVTSNRSYNNEDALQSAIYLAYIFALNHYDGGVKRYFDPTWCHGPCHDHRT